MHDIQKIRDNPDAFDKGLARRGLSPQSERILALDIARRKAVTQASEARSDLKELSEEIAIRKRAKLDCTAEVKAADLIKQSLKALADTETHRSQEHRAALSEIPNLPLDDVPDGSSEADNVVLREFGEIRRDSAEVPSHEKIGANLGWLDIESAVAMSGQRFAMLKGPLARMERALGAFMLDQNTHRYFEEVSPPLIVKSPAMYGTGQLPKFGDDLFRIAGDDAEQAQWLIPTAEVSLTNIVRDTIIEPFEKPLRYTALTPCFRAEAGAAGRDTSGLIRQHQFYKVELVSIAKPEASALEFGSILSAAENILRWLDLPYRVVQLCAGDLGFGSEMTYDLEVWFPSQQRYREISSISRFGDFQGRRLNARYRDDKGKTAFVHTLNGSGLAVGRTLAAIMENNYEAHNGSFTIPRILRPCMSTDGIDRWTIWK